MEEPRKGITTPWLRRKRQGEWREEQTGKEWAHHHVHLAVRLTLALRPCSATCSEMLLFDLSGPQFPLCEVKTTSPKALVNHDHEVVYIFSYMFLCS